MSIGRTIEENEKGLVVGSHRQKQAVRVFMAGQAVLVISVWLWRLGLPSTTAGGVAMAAEFLVGTISAAFYAAHRWPASFGRIHRVSQRFDPNRRLRLTRDGRILVGITIAVGAAAVNTGNNFLYLVLGLLLALVSVSGVLSEWGLRDVRVCLEAGGERFEATPGVVTFHTFNLKRSFNSMSLEISPLVQPPPGSTTEPLRLPGRFFMRLPPNSQHRGVVRAELPRRGVWRVLGFEVATAYPFGFFRKWKHEVPEPGEANEVLVFPRPVPVGEELRRIRMMVGERPGLRAGQGDEFFSLRDHRPQDDVRRVAWKRSARSGRLLVREDEEPRGRLLTLVVPGNLPQASDEAQKAWEQALRVTTGLILALLDRDEDVGVIAGAQLVLPNHGPSARTALLTALALANLADPFPTLPSHKALGTVVVVNAPGTVPAGLSTNLSVGAPSEKAA